MAPPARRESKASAGGAAATAPEQALAQLGLVRDIDLALHLPLRYEDETTIVPIASLHDGVTAQVEGVVADSRIQFRPRRQLVVKIADDSGDLVMRFLHFYPSQQKTLAVGRRVRARGEARGGFFGLEMVHPVVPGRDAGDAAADGVDSGLPEHRAAVAGGAAEGGRRRPRPRRPRRAPAAPASSRRVCRPCARRSITCTSRRPGSTRRRSRIARIRPGSVSSSRSCSPSSSRSCSRNESASASARRRSPPRAARCTQRFLAALPFSADARAAARRRRDRRRPRARRADAPAAAGRRRLGQDRRRRARRGARDRRRLAVRADGADRDPRRAAPEEARRLAGAARRHGRLADRQQEGQEARRDAGPGRVGRGRPRRRHARRHRGAGPLRAASAWRSSTSSTASASRRGWRCARSCTPAFSLCREGEGEGLSCPGGDGDRARSSRISS